MAAVSASVTIQADVLHSFVKTVFERAGVPPEQAADGADVLLYASQRGVDTHGVGNVVGYVQAIEQGVYTIPQAVEIIAESDTTALLDCGNGLGFVAAHRAMELSIAKARQHGVGMASVRNGHHIGMVGYYPLMAVAQDMIGMAVTNASRSMRPAQGAHPRLGTNPIAFGAPAGKERPFLLDMATTTVASGKAKLRFVHASPVIVFTSMLHAIFRSTMARTRAAGSSRGPKSSGCWIPSMPASTASTRSAGVPTPIR